MPNTVPPETAFHARRLAVHSRRLFYPNMKIVLAYSGGLDTSVLLSWIKDTYGNAEMICFCANIGQEDELKGLEKKAKKTGVFVICNSY